MSRTSKNEHRDSRDQGASEVTQQTLPVQIATSNAKMLIGLGCLLLLATVWAYWPTLQDMVHNWDQQPDYSHGYLVLPIALAFLYSRRDSLPADSISPSLWGLLALLVASGMRTYAGLYYLTPLDGWTLPITIAGIVWLVFGAKCLVWSFPAIVFLWFMLPIPYSAETGLSMPLQSLATKLSTAALVCLGQQAIAEGNTIFLGDQQLFVEEACSGLRIFVGIFALAFAFVLFSRWSWWQKVIVLVSALPVAIIANVSRIVITGLLTEFASGEAARSFSHDFAGFVMIPFAALLFWLFLLYLDRLFLEVEDVALVPTHKS